LAVYFDTAKLKDYGKLTGQQPQDKETAVRQDIVVDISKKSPRDFALWIFTKGKHSSHAMRWQSPWGQGFPGWHIECSTIIKKYLGDTIDIHTGGVDHIGTHHTNEIAQSEALTGKPLARIWMHSEFLLVDNQKMSKSLGNTYRIVDLESHGFDRLAYRLLVLQSHYRAQQNFTWQALKDSQHYLKNLQAAADMRFQPKGKSAHKFDPAKRAVLAALAGDLNSPVALSKLNGVFSAAANSRIGKNQAGEFTSFIEWTDSLLGLELSKSSDITSAQKKLIHGRESARQDKNWTLSDKLRDQLLRQGIALRDMAGQTVWYRT
jgi:cysteinyl-tRNA synthetase